MYKWSSEKELAQVVVNYLKQEKWTVYPELCNIDIVATFFDDNSINKTKIIGIECKKNFNLKVLSQAYDRRNLVDEMYIAVPEKYDMEHFFGTKVAEKFNIGVFSVSKNHYSSNARLMFKPISNDRKVQNIDKLLDPKAETYAEAGSAGGRQWTGFRKTVGIITDYVKEHPGISLKEILKNIKHHYKTNNSAYCNLKKLIDDNVIKELKIVDKKVYLKDYIL